MALRMAGTDFDDRLIRRTFAQGLPNPAPVTMTWWYYQDSNRGTYNSYMAAGPTTFTGSDYYFCGHFNDASFSYEIAVNAQDVLGVPSVAGRWIRQGFRCVKVSGSSDHKLEFWTNLPSNEVITYTNPNSLVWGANTELRFGGPAHNTVESIDGRMAGIKIWEAALPLEAIKREAMSDMLVLPQYAPRIWAIVPARVAGDYKDYSGKGRHFTPRNTITSIAGPGSARKDQASFWLPSDAIIPPGGGSVRQALGLSLGLGINI